MMLTSLTMVGWADVPDGDWGDFRRRRAVDISSCVMWTEYEWRDITYNPPRVSVSILYLYVFRIFLNKNFLNFELEVSGLLHSQGFPMLFASLYLRTQTVYSIHVDITRPAGHHAMLK